MPFFNLELDMKFVNFEKKLNLILVVLSLGTKLSIEGSTGLSRGTATMTRVAQKSIAIPSRTFGSQTMRMPINPDARGISTSVVSTRPFSLQASQSSSDFVLGTEEKVPTYFGKQSAAINPDQVSFVEYQTGKEISPAVTNPLDNQIAKMERLMAQETDSVARARYQSKIDELKAEKKNKEQEEQRDEKQQEQQLQQQQKKSLWAKFMTLLGLYQR